MSILNQVRADLEKARKESVKAKVKKLYEDYLASVEVTKGIEAKIVEELSTIGETEETIRELLTE